MKFSLLPEDLGNFFLEGRKARYARENLPRSFAGAVSGG
jgi:hypothetical protein